MSDVKLMDPYVLRVRYGSELDTALRALDESPKSPDEITELTGKNRTLYYMRTFLTDNFDNVDVSYEWGNKNGPHQLRYTDVMPNKISIDSAQFSGSHDVEQRSHDDEMELQFQWPVAPPIISKMANFDEPSWFSDMEFMVRRGRHISLEGPPGVGKDTAVEQLAARHSKPLVTIGGDAGFRKRDLVGSPQIANGTSYFQVAEYVAAAINGWWVLLSEVNAADPDALMYINTQLAPPNIVTFQGKAYPVHKDFRIFVSYNHGLIGTKPLPQSFKDRFYSIKVPFFSEYQLRRRLEAMGMPTAYPEEYFLPWTQTIVDFGIAMWDAHQRGQMRYQITTRRLIDAVALLDRNQDVRDALRKAVISAIDSPVEANEAEVVLKKLNIVS